MEDLDLRGDPKYKAFRLSVERALKTFETTSGWPDLIGAVNKLNKVLSANQKFSSIPFKLLVGKRLAQCLHPSLPAGLHMSALNTYNLIFNTIGTNRLGQDLFIYSKGLFPLLENASMAVRPELISIYETHLMPLGIRLRPALSGLLSSIFLGFEEDPQSDYCKRLFSLLDSICEATHKDFFYGSLWEIVLSNPAVRHWAIYYAMDNLDSTKGISNQSYLLGTDTSVVVKSLCRCVEDTTNLYVQRLALDFTCGMFAFHYDDLISFEDRVQLLTASVPVIRMDSSLEKRFYRWVMQGPCEGSASEPIKTERSISCDSDHISSWYFDHWTRKAFVKAIQQTLIKSLRHGELPDLHAYKLLSKLLEKDELRQVIMEDVIIDIFRTLYHGRAIFIEKASSSLEKQNSGTVTNVEDLIKQAKILINDLTSSFVWDFFGRQFEKVSLRAFRISDSDSDPVNEVGSPEITIVELCAILQLILEMVYTSETKQLPMLFQRVLKVLTDRCEKLSADELTRSLQLCLKMLCTIELNLVTWSEENQENSIESCNLGSSFNYSGLSESGQFPVEVCLEHATVNLDDGEKSYLEARVAFQKTMEECIKEFKSFFVEFFRTRIITPKVSNPKDIIQQTLFTVLQSSKDRNDYLEDILNDDAIENELSEDVLDATEKLCEVEIPLREGALRLHQSFSLACKIAVQLTIPLFLQSTEEISKPSHIFSNASSTLDIPDWLSYLLITSSLLSFRYSDFLLSSIETLLSLAESVENLKIMKQEEPKSLVIVLVPLLDAVDFLKVCQRTVIPFIIASKLWQGLEKMSSVHHKKCVQLLFKLQNTRPSPNGIEPILARSLTMRSQISENEGDFGAFQKFTLFWHLSRDIISETNDLSNEKRPPAKNFDVCLKLMLDNLNQISGPLKTLTETWLVHSLTRGDLFRILEPHLLTLLDPSTARVSVIHCLVEICTSPDDVIERDKLERSSPPKVYLVKTLGGETFHHVAFGTHIQWRNDKRSENSLPSPESFRQKTKTANKYMFLTKRENSKQIASRPKGVFDLSAMPIQLNPFALVPPETDNFDSYIYGYGKRPSSRHTVRSADTSSYSNSSKTSIYESMESISGISLDDNDTHLNSVQVHQLVSLIVDDLISSAVERAITDKKFQSFNREEFLVDNLQVGSNPSPRNPMVLHLHSHVLLYTQVADSSQVLFSMQSIKNILQTNPRQCLGKLTTTTLSTAQAPKKLQIQTLLARHRKSVFGNGFTGELSHDYITNYRSNSLFEVLLSNLLSNLRSYYPNLGLEQVQEEIRGNREVQLMSINIIISLVSELSLMVRDNGRAFATFIYDIFSRCKVHKVVLHTLLACVNDVRRLKSDPGFTDDILNFNEVYAEGNTANTSQKISNYSEAFQIQLLRLLLSLIILEQIVSQQKGDAREKVGETARPLSTQFVRFFPERVIPDQPLFLVAISTALRQDKIRHLHGHWTSLVTSCLPFLGKSLSVTALETIAILCQNLERLSVIYHTDDDEIISELGPIPADYVITQLEALIVVYHFCVLDSYSQVNMTFPTPMSNQSNNFVAPSASSELLNNLRHAFLPSFDPKQLATNMSGSCGPDALANARRNLLSKLPRLITCCVKLWMAIEKSKETDSTCLLIGDPKEVQQRLIDFLSPIGHHHAAQFLSAVALNWQDPKANLSQTSSIPPTCTEEQMVSVAIVSAMKSMPVATIIQTLRQVLKSPPVLEGVSAMQAVVSILQFFYFYLAECSAKQVFLSWSNLACLLRECLGLSPPAIFMAVSILSQFVHRSQQLCAEGLNQQDGLNSGVLEKKDQRELQELAGKLIDACASIAGSFLEQTTWLRRNFVVNSDLQEQTAENDFDDDGKLSLHHYAVQAMSLLGEFLAPLLDIIYRSDEKDKVVPLLSSLLQVVMPYLRTHSKGNVACFCASSRLLSSLSEYTYTRKSWKKEGMELLFETSFFQMDQASLRHWKIIIDNLLTQDKKTMEELLTKVSTISVGLFSTKDQEYEQRAMLLKRLAFVIFCSENDQHEKYMNEIEDKIVMSIRQHNTYLAIQSTVFLCFRVILLRMSPSKVAHLWPVIVTEMIMVFQSLEMELIVKTAENCNSNGYNWKKYDSEFLKTLDRSDMAAVDELVSRNNPPGHAVFLAVCKLLDLCMAMPAHLMPQFQMYRCEFVSDSSLSSFSTSNYKPRATNGDTSLVIVQQDFIPFIDRLARKFPDVEPVNANPGEPLLKMKAITCLEDLAPFFVSLKEGGNRHSTQWTQVDEDRFNSILEIDFIETIPK